MEIRQKQHGHFNFERDKTQIKLKTNNTNKS